MKKCSEMAYGIHVLAGYIGIIGLLSLIGMVIAVIITDDIIKGWHFVIPFATGFVGWRIHNLSWLVAKQKDMSTTTKNAKRVGSKMVSKKLTSTGPNKLLQLTPKPSLLFVHVDSAPLLHKNSLRFGRN